MSIYAIIHIILAVLLSIYFIYDYRKEKSIYKILLIIWIPLTLLRYLSENRIFLTIIGIIQIIMFLLVLFFMFKPSKIIKNHESKKSSDNLDTILSSKHNSQTLEDVKDTNIDNNIEE